MARSSRKAAKRSQSGKATATRARSRSARSGKSTVATDSTPGLGQVLLAGPALPRAYAMSTMTETLSSSPGDLQLQVDVHSCLLDAMTDCFPIARASINATTVPSNPPIGADGQGWGICLASFAEYLASLRPFYAFYVHKPAYTIATLSQPFPAIVMYLKERVRAQFFGSE